MKAVKAVKEEWGKRMKRVGERRKKQKEMDGRKGRKKEEGREGSSGGRREEKRSRGTMIDKALIH